MDLRALAIIVVGVVRAVVRTFQRPGRHRRNTEGRHGRARGDREHPDPPDQDKH